MRTEDLIATLSANLKPAQRGAVGRRLAIGIAAGALGSVLVLAALLGFRADLWLAMQGPAFWMKSGYTASLAAIALLAVAQLARPEPRRLQALWLLALPVLALAGIGATELSRAPRSDWLAMWLGRTWHTCPWLVLMLAGPIFVGLLWSFRRLAPTRLRAAGAAAGLAAGAVAATLYCLHCPEVSALFVLTWYSLGVALAAAFGALVGPRLLHW